ncbi:Putative Ubiquitin-like domain-containing protein [Septoria linicola]|uniref:Ubiquitin-like domain-containing protein n=1 Tax=Septoria linicola TaxID=215465 RepID=A0A9Q9B544_9PEZI|nr:putative Ubiquitin-like domain-containing protein [Septoria linicola]USW57537.1 Putative Ubiquitin-like domain-containing protein [Septoria linicola]
MAIKNTFEMPIGRVNIKVMIELGDDFSGASPANRMLLARLTSKVADAVAESSQGDAIAEPLPCTQDGPIDVDLSVTDCNGDRNHYKGKTTTSFHKVATAEAIRLGAASDQLRFFPATGGPQLRGEDTFAQCGIEDGAVLVVHGKQAGS